MISILYLCDEKACELCRPNKASKCRHTNNVEHALNYNSEAEAKRRIYTNFDKIQYDGDVLFMEKEVNGVIGKPIFMKMYVDEVKEDPDGGYYVSCHMPGDIRNELKIHIEEGAPKVGSKVFINLEWRVGRAPK